MERYAYVKLLIYFAEQWHLFAFYTLDVLGLHASCMVVQNSAT